MFGADSEAPLPGLFFMLALTCLNTSLALGRWCGSEAHMLVSRSYMSSGQAAGWASRSPRSSSGTTSALRTPCQGFSPKEKISQKHTPSMYVSVLLLKRRKFSDSSGSHLSGSLAELAERGRVTYSTRLHL